MNNNYPSKLTAEESLCWAISKGELNKVKRILEKKPALASMLINKKFTPLHLAVDYQQLGIIDYLLTFPKIDINAPDNRSRSPLHIAGIRGNAKIIQMLCSCKKIDVNIITKVAKSPLAYTIKFGSLDAVKTLSSCSKVDIFSCDIDGSNALHIAAEHNRPDVIEFFSKKIPINNKNFLGYSPLSVAAGFCNDEALKKLIELGACCNDTSDITKSPLYLCIAKNLMATTAILIDSGALMSQELWKQICKKKCFSSAVKTLLIDKFVKKDLDNETHASIYKGMCRAIKKKKFTNSLEKICCKYVQKISQDYGTDIILTEEEEKVEKRYFK